MSDHVRRAADTFTGKLERLWPMIVAIISVVVMATTVKNKVDDHETRLQRLENAMGTIQANTNRLVDELLEKK